MTHPTVHAEKERRGGRFLRRDLLGLGLLALGSLGVGGLANALRPHPLPLVYATPKVRIDEIAARMSVKSSLPARPLPNPGPWRAIDLDGFQEFVSSHKGVSIDARPKGFYQLGHVPGALNLPREDFENGYAGVRALLEPEKERPIIVYCAEADCQDSELVADALGRLGYRQLFVYKDGWEEWLRAGLPQETGHPL